MGEDWEHEHLRRTRDFGTGTYSGGSSLWLKMRDAMV